MAMHNHYVIVISGVFALIFVIMLHSLIRHRQSGEEPSRFGGPTGRVQWLWALVPMAILGAVNLALIERHDDRSAVQRTVADGKIELAAVHK